MPLNTYGHSLGPAADVYEDVYFISPVTDTWPHMSSSSSSSPNLSLRFSLHPERQAAASPLPGLARAPRPSTTDHLRLHTFHRWHRSDTTRPTRCFLSSIRAHSAIATLSQAPPPPWPCRGRALRSPPTHYRSLHSFLRWRRKGKPHPPRWFSLWVVTHIATRHARRSIFFATVRPSVLPPFAVPSQTPRTPFPAA